MRDNEMDELLMATAEDRRLSRGERKALRAVVEDEGLDDATLARFRSRAFLAARHLAKHGRPSGDIVDWLEDTIKALLPRRVESEAEVHFSPGEDCRRAIVANLGAATRAADICVFTITDDRITEAIVRAHRRGVKVRVISDDDKAEDRGSDVDGLARLGVPVRVDRTKAHMHHKFAIIDGDRLLTGSYNWTRSAFLENQENIVVTDDARIVAEFTRTFDSLWSRFGP